LAWLDQAIFYRHLILPSREVKVRCCGAPALLFWAVVMTKSYDPPAGSEGSAEEKKYQEIQLAWSKYRHDAWSPKQVTNVEQVLPPSIVAMPPAASASHRQRPRRSIVRTSVSPTRMPLAA
jgi:hypothetical protein